MLLTMCGKEICIVIPHSLSPRKYYSSHTSSTFGDDFDLRDRPLCKCVIMMDFISDKYQTMDKVLNAVIQKFNMIYVYVMYKLFYVLSHRKSKLDLNVWI
jgi:hypothetical protein